MKTYEEWLYLVIVFDIYPLMIVGWSMAVNMTAELVDDVLRMGAVRRKPAPGLIHHSDHGSHYRPLLLGRTMKRFEIVSSKASISSPWDNAVIESLEPSKRNPSIAGPSRQETMHDSRYSIT